MNDQTIPTDHQHVQAEYTARTAIIVWLRCAFVYVTAEYAYGCLNKSCAMHMMVLLVAPLPRKHTHVFNTH
jgi:hypothetical protein